MYKQHPTKLEHLNLVHPASFVLSAIIASLLALVGCSPDDGNATDPYAIGAGGLGVGGAAAGGAGVAGGGAGMGGSNASGGAPQNNASWCAVEALLKAKCQSCHNEALAFGAPMELLDHADMMASTPLAKRPAWQVALERVKATGKERMPPSPNQPLTQADIAPLEAWISAGQPAGTCGTSSTGGAPNAGGNSGSGGNPSAGGAGGSNTGGSVNPGSGGSATGPFSTDNYPSDCIDCGNYSCGEGNKRIAFRAHKNPGAEDKTPFDAAVVGANGQPNSYECFYYEAPWTSTTQLVGSRPIIDNERVIHHWLLYASNTPPVDLQHGGRRGYCQFQPDANRQLLAGWAPGTPGAMLPSNVGQALPQGQRVFVTLEVHYFNTKPGEPAPDRSGVEVCLTDTPRPNVASMHWLGTENINIPANGQAVAGDVCTPNQGKTSTILRVWPHMHLTGTHAKLELIKQGGARQTLHDGDFAFENQTMYEMQTPVTVNPGDKLDARCTFQNKENRIINFGEGSTEEMCYIFTLAYPAGSLHNGRNGCLPGVGCVPGGILRCIDNENILTALGGL